MKTAIAPENLDIADVWRLASALSALKLSARIAKDNLSHPLVKGRRHALFAINDAINELEHLLGVGKVSASADTEAIVKLYRNMYKQKSV